MNGYERKWLINFARFVRRGDSYSHWDLVDALPSSLVGKIVWLADLMLAQDMLKREGSYLREELDFGFISGLLTGS